MKDFTFNNNIFLIIFTLLHINMFGVHYINTHNKREFLQKWL